MKRTIILVISFLSLFGNNVFLSAQSQAIKYETSFEKAKVRALTENKPIAILLTVEIPAAFKNAPAVLDNSMVVEKYNSNFVNYKVAKEDTLHSNPIIREFKIYRFPSFLFLDSKGGLIFTDVALMSLYQALVGMADKALAESKEMSLIDYDTVYKEGIRDADFLKKYILKRLKAGINDNSELIEKYVNKLKVEDFDNYNQILFVLKAGPVLNGRAYKLAYSNQQLIDSLFRVEPPADRKAINNCIITNSMNKAIRTKNFQMASAVASFVYGTWSNDPKEGFRNQQFELIKYYRGVSDTLNYLRSASNYYDSYYMEVSLDSIQRREEMNLENNLKTAMQNITVKMVNNTSFTRSFTVSRPQNSVSAIELNNAAWSLYQFAGNRPDYLIKAMKWVRRSIVLEPLPAFYDTNAHILYKLGFYEEALNAEKTAIEQAEIKMENTKNLRLELDKMKKRTL